MTYDPDHYLMREHAVTANVIKLNRARDVDSVIDDIRKAEPVAVAVIYVHENGGTSFDAAGMTPERLIFLTELWKRDLLACE